MNNQYVLLGSGGHAKVIFEMAKENNITISAISDKKHKFPDIFKSIKKISDDELLKYDVKTTILINGVGSLPSDNIHEHIFTRFENFGFRFQTLISRNSIVSASSNLGEGVVVMAGVIIQANTVIKKNAIINTRSSVDHDCVIGEHCHLAPGVTLSGLVTLDNNVHVGTGACIIQGVHVENHCSIGAGAIIYKNVPAYSKVRSQCSMIIEPL
jgi:UDP-perosamine 4-acetyltransferase